MFVLIHERLFSLNLVRSAITLRQGTRVMMKKLDGMNPTVRVRPTLRIATSGSRPCSPRWRQKRQRKLTLEKLHAYVLGRRHNCVFSAFNQFCASLAIQFSASCRDSK